MRSTGPNSEVPPGAQTDGAESVSRLPGGAGRMPSGFQLSASLEEAPQLRVELSLPLQDLDPAASTEILQLVDLSMRGTQASIRLARSRGGSRPPVPEGKDHQDDQSDHQRG